jgi:hypothetical protein
MTASDGTQAQSLILALAVGTDGQGGRHPQRPERKSSQQSPNSASS